MHIKSLHSTALHTAATCVLVLHLMEVTRAISVPNVGHQLLWQLYQLKRSVRKKETTQHCNVHGQQMRHSQFWRIVSEITARRSAMDSTPSMSWRVMVIVCNQGHTRYRSSDHKGVPSIGLSKSFLVILLMILQNQHIQTTTPRISLYSVMCIMGEVIFSMHAHTLSI